MVFDLAGLLLVLSEAQIRFVVVGGIAVVAHAHIRATEDLDLVPDPAHDNLDELVNVLVSIDGRLTSSGKGLGPELRLALRRGANASVTTRLGDVDVVQRLPGVPGYAELAQRAQRAELHGASFLVCSRDDLIAMKRASGRHLDLADLERLEPSSDG